jgi:hypothetical protein
VLFGCCHNCRDLSDRIKLDLKWVALGKVKPTNAIVHAESSFDPEVEQSAQDANREIPNGRPHSIHRAGEIRRSDRVEQLFVQDIEPIPRLPYAAGVTFAAFSIFKEDIHRRLVGNGRLSLLLARGPISHNLVERNFIWFQKSESIGGLLLLRRRRMLAPRVPKFSSLIR